MYLRKKWLAMSAVITTVLLLGACGGKESANDNPVHDSGGPQDGSPNDILPLSEAFEQYPVWISTGSDPDRDSTVSRLSFFENGNVKLYEFTKEVPPSRSSVTRAPTFETTDEALTMEEIVDMSDEEIIEYARTYGIEKDLGTYTIDLELDDKGNHTERLNLLVQGKEDSIGRFQQKPTNVTIFGTTFSGFEGAYVTGRSYDTGRGNFLTRVDDSFVGFELDKPDTDKKNVTIEGK